MTRQRAAKDQGRACGSPLSSRMPPLGCSNTNITLPAAGAQLTAYGPGCMATAPAAQDQSIAACVAGCVVHSHPTLHSCRLRRSACAHALSQFMSSAHAHARTPAHAKARWPKEEPLPLPPYMVQRGAQRCPRPRGAQSTC